MPSGPGCQARCRRWAAATVAPWLLKPMRLMTAWCSGRRNRRGVGLPGWGRGVTVPISTAEKPQANRPSTASASLSRPAARATGWAKRRPATSTASASETPRRARARRDWHSSWECPSSRRPKRPSRCAGSAGSRKSSERVSPYMRAGSGGDERRLAGPGECLVHLLWREDAVVLHQLDFPAHVRLEQVGAVGVDGELHLAVPEGADDVAQLLHALHRLGVQVGRRAQLQDDVVLAEHLHRRLVIGRADAMADAVRLELLHHGHDALGARAARLAGVHRALQARAPRPAEEVLVLRHDLRLELHGVGLRAGQVDAVHAARAVLDGLVHQDAVEPVVELAGQAEDEAHLHAVLEHRAVHAPQRRVDDVVQVQLGLEVALHGVEAQLDLRHPAAPVLLADDFVDGALNRAGRRLNLLRPGVEDLQVVIQAPHLARTGGDELHEVEVRLDRELEALLMGDGPEDVGGHRAAHVDVEVDQFACHGGMYAQCRAHVKDTAVTVSAGRRPPPFLRLADVRWRTPAAVLQCASVTTTTSSAPSAPASGPWSANRVRGR